MVTQFFVMERWNVPLLINDLFYLTSELERDGFCQNPFFECLVAEVPEEHKSKEGEVLIGPALSASFELVGMLYRS